MKRLIRALIVDDDSMARDILAKFLELDRVVEIVGRDRDTASAMQTMNRCVPDVVFLDVNMPKEDGIQFARKLRNLNIDVQIVFTTAFRNYAASAFSLKPIDFLVKPFGYEEVGEVVAKLKAFFEKQDELKKENRVWGREIPNRLKFKTKMGYCFIDPNDILYVKVVASITEIILKNGEKERILMILNNVYEELCGFHFLRLNRSIIINLDYLDRVDKNTHECVLKSGNEEYVFSISRSAFKYFENLDSIKLG